MLGNLTYPEWVLVLAALNLLLLFGNKDLL